MCLFKGYKGTEPRFRIWPRFWLYDGPLRSLSYVSSYYDRSEDLSLREDYPDANVKKNETCEAERSKRMRSD